MSTTGSTALSCIFYDPARHELRVTFRDSRRTFVYEDVQEEEFEDLLAAESLGGYFAAHIRDHHPSREI